MPETKAISHTLPLSRRAFVASSALSALAIGAATQARASDPHHRRLTHTDDFDYAVTRSDEEWRAMLTQDEYDIMRRGNTEFPKSSPLWNEQRNGLYHCRGCDLEAYDARWKVPLDKGWVFFTHSQTNAVLTGIDGPVAEYGNAMGDSTIAHVEVHCRRCGSHLGHLLPVDGHQVHCINGAALTFEAAAA
ncbi:peptide-methionine (R)-S-oxide reductase [uncultured Litoreibacter sp.]|uniref:peptide-methionine (R)-S-oxide reductase n=1 Tax=uncultured Litoreibacter sp. TaxID=1392394 RepID=UPI002617EA6F|nr:peptide-methionine (R)-S-oxide reductase [uncultured Litoreibacter sp.]